MVSYRLGKIRWDYPELNDLLNSPAGLVGRELTKRGERVARAARSQAGVRTGALKSSIHITKRGRFTGGQYVQVGSYLPYALLHHQGTKPRVIVPTKRRVLRFFVKGLLVFTPFVLNKGTRPNRYLTDNLYKAVY